MYLVMQKLALLFICAFVLLTFSTNVHAQFRDARPAAKADTASNLNVSAEYLLSPLSQPLISADSFYSIGETAYNQPLQLGNITKLLLKGGVDLLRGGSEDVPLYSFENAWTYPGPTVRYPETVSEYESFLKRYDQYNPDAQ